MPSGIYKRSKKHRKKLSETKKGINNPNWGKVPSLETIRKMKEKRRGKKPCLGKKPTDATKAKISKANTGKKRSKETKRKLSLSLKGRIPWNKGKKIGHFSKEHKKKLSESHKGLLAKEKHPCWQNGKSFEPYGLEFNEDLKEVIRNRDRRKCQICKKTELDNGEKLSVHHINYNKLDNYPNNLISLCRRCHSKTNHGHQHWIEYFNN